jgi:hypothetical protein
MPMVPISYIPEITSIHRCLPYASFRCKRSWWDNRDVWRNCDRIKIIQDEIGHQIVNRVGTGSCEESVPYVLWMLMLMNDLHLIAKRPVEVMQDNLSAIGIITNGGSFNRSKHMIARHGFVKQHVELGDITFKHCSGDVMPADMLTDHVQSELTSNAILS